MRILHIITSLWTGGAEKLMVDLLPRLKDHGHEVELLTFNGDRTAFRKQLDYAGIKVYDLGCGASTISMYSPKNIFKLVPLLRRYDIVHTHNTAPQLFAAIASMVGKSILITTEHTTSNRRRGNKFLTIVDKWMYSRYNHIICISKKTEENLIAHLGECNTEISTVNNGIDISEFSNAKPKSSLEKLAPNSKKIVMVAGFRLEKDQETLIRAMKRLPEEFHLFLVGDGERRRDLETLTNTLDLSSRVHFLGIRNDITEILKEVEYSVLSSHWEGFGLSAVEGMSAGKPVLASNVDGLREVIAGAGILFEHGNDEQLANEIMKLDSDDNYYNSIATKCKNRAMSYDISKMVDGYLEVYNELIK